MALVAPDTDPTVVPTPLRKQGSVWTLLSGLAGLLLVLIPSIPVPDQFKVYVPVVTSILGWLAHQTWGADEYQPAPPPKS